MSICGVAKSRKLNAVLVAFAWRLPNKLIKNFVPVLVLFAEQNSQSFVQQKGWRSLFMMQ